jgi:hypothetical protein
MNSKVIDWSYYKGTVPGYGACRAVPGEYACLLPDRHVESFLGIAALPGENINYLRIPHNPGDGRMAGGGQTHDQVLEWDVTHWALRGTMFGPNGCVYGGGDTLCANVDRADYAATGGYRYGHGALIPCVGSYANVPRGLYEYTDFGDVAIGQGADGRAVVSFRATAGGYEPLRVLPMPTPCDARFMLTDRQGDQFGITAVDLAGRKTYFFWPTLAELRALPKA